MRRDSQALATFRWHGQAKTLALTAPRPAPVPAAEPASDRAARCCFLVYFARFVSHSAVTEWLINRIDVKQQDETQWVPSGVWHVTYGR